LAEFSKAASEADPEQEDVVVSPHTGRMPWILRRAYDVCTVTTLSYELTIVTGLLLTYVVGALIAAAEGLLTAYLGWYIFPAVLFEIGWIIAWLDWGSRTYINILEKWRKNFGPKYGALLDRHLDRMLTDRGSVWVVGLVLGVGDGDIIGTRISDGTTLKVATISNWIVLGPWPTFVFLMAVLTVGGIVAGGAIYAALEHVRFIREISRLRVNSLRLLSSETYFGDLANMGLALSMVCFVGVAVVGIVLYGDLNPVTIPLYALAAAMGLAFFFVPQLYLYRMIVDSKSRLKTRLRRMLPGDWQESDVMLAGNQTPQVLALIQQVDTIRDWPINVPVILLEVVSALIPFGATFVAESSGFRVSG
jgi:hypothetical protein